MPKWESRRCHSCWDLSQLGLLTTVIYRTNSFQFTYIYDLFHPLYLSGTLLKCRQISHLHSVRAKAVPQLCCFTPRKLTWWRSWSLKERRRNRFENHLEFIWLPISEAFRKLFKDTSTLSDYFPKVSEFRRLLRVCEDFREDLKMFRHKLCKQSQWPFINRLAMEVTAIDRIQ